MDLLTNGHEEGQEVDETVMEESREVLWESRFEWFQSWGCGKV